MLMMGCHCSWQHPRLTNLRKYYLSPLHLTSNQSHQKFQRGANEETSSQYEVWGPTDGSRLVAWEELTLLPAPSFSPQPPLLLPSCSTKREAGSEKARDPAAIQPLLPLLEDIGLYLGEEKNLDKKSHPWELWDPFLGELPGKRRWCFALGPTCVPFGQ